MTVSIRYRQKTKLEIDWFSLLQSKQPFLILNLILKFPEFQFAVLTLTNDNDRQQSKTQ